MITNIISPISFASSNKPSTVRTAYDKALYQIGEIANQAAQSSNATQVSGLNTKIPMQGVAGSRLNVIA